MYAHYIMHRCIIVLCTILALLTVPSQQQGSQASTPTSPCPNVFVYDPQGAEPGWWSGVATLSSNIVLHSVWLNVVLDRQALSLGQLWNWIGNATTQDGIDFEIENDEMEIHPGHPIQVRFFIQYDPLNTTPRLRAIRLNGKDICNADTHQKAIGGRHDINRSNVGQPNSNSLEKKLWTNLDQSEPSAEQGYSNIPATSETVRCGVVSNDNAISSLYFNSVTYTKGDLPWLVAIYKKEGMTFKFICAGTLVSDRHIVTAGVCVQNRNKNTEAKELLVRLGIHNLDDWSDDDIITRNLASLHLHEDYDNGTLENDIAILTLDKPVKFNAYIRPACLWSSDTELSRVVGATGVVAGWGIQTEEIHGRHDEPFRVLVPIVSTGYCRRTHSILNQLTTTRTLCAGARNGQGPCLGDSGAGLVILDGGKWTLRGLVSVSLRSDTPEGDFTCDHKEYVVYTDTAQFLMWIRNIVSERDLKVAP